MKLRIAIAAVAATALGVSACGGADTPTDPAETTPAAVTQTTPAATPSEESPATETEAEPTTEETTAEAPEETTEPAAPVSGELPWDEGPIDTTEFFTVYGPAQKNVKTMKMTSTSSMAPDQESVTYIDQSDPTKVRAYSVTEAAGVKIETVLDGQTSHTRMNDGEWESTELNIPGLGGSPAPGAENPVGGVEVPSQFDFDADPADSVTAITLVDKAERKFEVDLKPVDGAPSEVGVESAFWWLDDQMRTVKTEVEIMGMTATTTYSDFDQPIDFPQVP